MRGIHFHTGTPFQAPAAGFAKLTLCILVVLCGVILTSELFSKGPDHALSTVWLEKDRAAPVDYGFGPGAGIGHPRPNRVLGETPTAPKATLAAPVGAGNIPNGGGNGGFFGPDVLVWPIIPLHMTLLPNGRVLTYGTDQSGRQGAQLIYDVWDPSVGNGSSAHSTLPNTTSTDIFCSAASLISAGLTGATSSTGDVLITGGDRTINGIRNNANNQVNLFNPSNNVLAASGTMSFPRWYPTITTLRNGDKLVLGGMSGGGVAVTTPEVFSPSTGWRKLSSVSVGQNAEYWYPRAFVGPDGAVTYIQHNGQIFRITPNGTGTVQDTGLRVAAASHGYPSVIVAPFKVLTIRNGRTAQIVDLSKLEVTTVSPLHFDRVWGSATVLADGRILVTGGSGADNELVNVAKQSEIFDPSSGTWTLGASASKPRLYHSAALLLPDGSVLTGGGGAPGPVNNLNAEIYYPDYLYEKNGSGNPAPRPTIVSAPATVKLGQTFTLTVGPHDLIGKFNLLKLGADTHSIDLEQRMVPVPFTQSGATVTGTLDFAAEKIPPGYYMLFVFNTNGVPAVARIISVPQAVQAAFGSPSPSSATFIKFDTATRGSWSGVYGADGYIVSQDSNTKIPNYAQVKFTGASNYVWASSPTDARALQRPEKLSSRIAATWFAVGSFSISSNLTDGNPHQVALYLLDWDSTTRAQTVTVTDAVTGAALDTRVFSAGSFNHGEYAVWTVKGNVTFKATRDHGANAVVSGIFFR